MLFYWSDLEYFQDVLDVDDAAGLLVDHGDDSLVDLERVSCAEFYFVEFLEEGFDEHAEMEDGVFKPVGVAMVMMVLVEMNIDMLVW